MAAPSPQPPKRNWWPVEIPGVIGSTHRIGLWVGSRPSQAGASMGAEPSLWTRKPWSERCVTGVAPVARHDCHTPWVD